MVVAACLVSNAQAFDPAYEAANFAKINERALTDYTVEFNALLAAEGLENEADSNLIRLNDPITSQYGREFGGNLCSRPMNGCAGDVRLYDWGEKGYGIVEPILFTARNGSTLSGHVWRTSAGPKRKPGVVITNGSVQAPETLYWFAAQTLAKAGYVVMTWDPQGQGMSDTFGEGPDRMDGVPSQQGRPFYDGTEDALDFFFSTPGEPYVPRPSCTTATSHADKQEARVEIGRSSAYNPFFTQLDPTRVGIVGHSLGAAAVSYVGQLDKRVDTVVAYDNLRDPSDPEATAQECLPESSPRPAQVRLRVPMLGMSADYGLVPEPFTEDPDPLGKSTASLAASEADIDTGQLNIRGGTHYEFSYIPNPAFAATARGMDMVAWYTVAWMDKYLRKDKTADARLLTTRWNDDALEKAVDTQGDGNLFSGYSRRAGSTSAAGRASPARTCAPGARARGLTALPADYSFLAATQTPDPKAGGTTQWAGTPGVPPAATGEKALKAIEAARGCAPTSRITKAKLRGRKLIVRGTASGLTRLPQAGHGRRRHHPLGQEDPDDQGEGHDPLDGARQAEGRPLRGPLAGPHGHGDRARQGQGAPRARQAKLKPSGAVTRTRRPSGSSPSTSWAIASASCDLAAVRAPSSVRATTMPMPAEPSFS